MQYGVITGKKLFISLIVILVLLSTVLPVQQAEAATGTKGYLLMVEEKDGSWSEYGNCIEIKDKDKLMVSASDTAEKIGIVYKAKDKNSFTISNGKKKNTYTINSVKYKYDNGSKSVSKAAAYKAYLNPTTKIAMVEYRTLMSLVSIKLFNNKEAGGYQKAGYSGVLCVSKYNKITKLPDMEEGTRVATEKELQQAIQEEKVNHIIITEDMTLKEEIICEREEKPVTIHIQKGKTLTINDYLLWVGGSITNDGTIRMKGTLERGICNLMNQGTVILEAGGESKSGMSDLSNKGSFQILKGAKLSIDRGSAFYNIGDVMNEGTISISDGGSFNDQGGKTTNHGIIELSSYYNGDISEISGDGIINDHREAIE